MKTSLFLVALLILAPLSMATVHAQESEELDVSLSPTFGSVAVSNSTTASLRVENTGLLPMTVGLTTKEPTGVDITFSRSSFTLPPTQSTNVTVTFKAKTNASIGAHNITITASDTGIGTARESVTYNLAVSAMYIAPGPGNESGGQDNTPSPRTPVAPRAEPGEVNLTVARGESAGVTVAISNPATFAQTFNASQNMPPEWTIDGAPTTFTLGGLERRLFALTVTAGSSAGHGEGLLTFANGSALDTIAFHLRIPGSSGSSSDGASGTQTTNQSSSSSSSNTTGDGSGNASASSRASGEVGPPELTLGVSRVDIVPGGTAEATLTITSNQPSAREAEFDIVTPEGLIVTITPKSVTIPPWESIDVTVKLDADDALETGAFRFVTVRLRDAPDVKLTINVKVDEDAPLQPASLTPETAANGAAPLSMNSGFIIGGTALLGAIIALLVALFFVRRAADKKKPNLMRAIEGLATRRPGIKARDLHEALDATSNAFERSLGKLVKTGNLAILGAGDDRRVYPVDAMPVAAVATQTAPRAPARRAAAAATAVVEEKPVHERAFRIIVEKGPLTSGELAATLGIAGATLEHHVERLVISGRVEVRIENGQRVLDLPQPGSA